MTDVRAEGELPDEDRLPWLEAVEEDEDEGGPSAAKLVVFVIVLLGVIGLVVGGGFWLLGRDAETSDTLIAAPEGDYKVAPDDPGGMAVEGEGDTAFAASEGADPRGNLNVNAVPEAPVTKAPATPPEKAGPQPKQAPSPVPQQRAEAPAAPAPAAPPPASAAGATIQLGAFSSQASANSAWRALSGRFAYLAPLGHSVSATTSDGRTLYRLRASGPNARDVCNRLRVAGETCLVVG